LAKKRFKSLVLTLFNALVAMLNKKLAVSIGRKILIALVATLFFGTIALIPRVGYEPKVRVYLPITKYYQYGFAIVDFNCNTSFNPFLYPVSWLFGRGRLSGNFSMIYLPQSYGGEGGRFTWGKLKVIESEASMKVVLEEFYMNLPILPLIFLAMELVGWRRLYLWFLGGVVGFIFGVVGVFFGFFIVTFSTSIIFPKLKKTASSRKHALESKA